MSSSLTLPFAFSFHDKGKDGYSLHLQCFLCILYTLLYCRGVSKLKLMINSKIIIRYVPCGVEI